MRSCHRPSSAAQRPTVTATRSRAPPRGRPRQPGSTRQSARRYRDPRAPTATRPRLEAGQGHEPVRPRQERVRARGAHRREVAPPATSHSSSPGSRSTCATCHRDFHRGELGANCARCHASAASRTGPGCTGPTSRPASRWRARTRRWIAGAAIRPRRLVASPGQPAHDCEACHAAELQGDQETRPRRGRIRPRTAPPVISAHAGRRAVRPCPRLRSPWPAPIFRRRCADCHANGVFKDMTAPASSCHQPDFTAATAPPHVAAGFPTDCTVCHAGTAAWQGATFDHGRTRFALTGAHQAASCKDCHADGAWSGRSMECVSCHRQACEARPDPAHTAAGFPTTCTHVPRHDRVARCDLRPHGHPVPTDWGARRHRVRRLPRRRRVQRQRHALRLAATSRLQRHRQPEPQCRGLPDDLRQLPQHRRRGRARPFNHAATQFPLTGAHLP